ncbi:MAG TPA: cytochrome c oxidase subunit II [Gaiellaceae bacterium]|nr:cytochrome c oxidase subunit II [Gaiellaceae bacterium]
MGIAALLAASGLTPIEPDSPNTERINDLFWFISFWAALVLLSVAIPLIYFVWRYRSRGRPRTVEGPQIRGNTRLEIAWTAVPVVILVVIAIFTFYKLPGITLEASAGEQAMTVQVEGRQFYWLYRYPNGVVAIDRMRVPQGRLVKLEITSAPWDVVHSYFVPALIAKMDAIPGKLNKVSFRAQRTGVYSGQCAEFCGLQHARMAQSIEVVPPAEFDSWLTEQAQAQETGDSDLGEQEFNGACAKCHGPQGEGLIGPGLTPSSVGNPASVKTIVTEGLGKMPPVARGWDERQLNALTTYLRQKFSSGGSSGG